MWLVRLSSLLTTRSTLVVSVSVAVLLFGLLSVWPVAVMVAVLVRLPDVAGSIVPLTTTLTEFPAPAGMSTPNEIALPLPLALPSQEAVPVTEHVHVTPVMLAGTLSANVAFVAFA